MRLKSAIWFPVAVGLTAINLIGVGFAVQPGEPLHASIHAALALAFGAWAMRLYHGRSGGALLAQVEDLALEVSQLRQELSEAQERLDFAERVLTQGAEPRRVEPETRG
jgi:hypothetical protein